MGWIKAVTPAVLGIAKRNPRAGKIAYNAINAISKGQKAAAPGVKAFATKAGKSLPYVGAGVTAIAATGSYQDAVARGEDPGRAAFRGIGEVGGGFIGGAIGSGAGPVGLIGGHLAGGAAGGYAADRIYDGLTGGDSSDRSEPAAMTPDEQRAYRRQMRAQGRLATRAGQDGMIDIAGFKYTPGVDPALVMGRMQQQFQNINAVQGFSRDKHMINAQLKGTLGQQATDRFGIGQMSQTERLGIMQSNLTARYGIGKEADVENRRTQRDTTLGLGAQYTQRYGTGRMYDSQDRQTKSNERLGLGAQYTQRYGIARGADNDRYGLETNRLLGFKDYDLKDKERVDKRYASELDYKSKIRGSDNLRDVGMYQAIGGLFRF